MGSFGMLDEECANLKVTNRAPSGVFVLFERFG